MGTIDSSPSTGVVVTGGGSGIGRATVLALAEAGRPVAAWDLNAVSAAESATEATRRFGVPACSIALDVRDTPAFSSAIARSREALGTIGGLVHAAGQVAPSAVDQLDEQSWDVVVDIHVKAAALLIRDLADDLAANPGSAVVVISSIEAIVGHEAIPAYCAAKAALLGLARSAALRLARRGVRVNAVCPGFIDTPMFRPSVEGRPGALATYEARVPLGRLGRPEEIARVVRFLLSEDAAYVTAAEFVVDGGVTRATF